MSKITNQSIPPFKKIQPWFNGLGEAVVINQPKSEKHSIQWSDL